MKYLITTLLLLVAIPVYAQFATGFAQGQASFFNLGSDGVTLSPVDNSWGLLINSSTTLQNFTFRNATGTSATTTNFFTTTASTTNLFGSGLTGCTGASQGLQWSNGVFSCTTLSGFASSTLLTDNNAFRGLNTFTDLALVTRSTTTNATTTGSLFSNFLGAVTASTTNLTAIGSTTLQNLTFISATSTGNFLQYPGAPVYKGGIDVNGSLTDVGNLNVVQAVVVGRYMYGVAQGTGGACGSGAGNAGGCAGIQVYDVSTSTPTYLGGAATDGTTNGGTGGTISSTAIVVKGNYAYVTMGASSTACSILPGNGAGNGCELKIFDISNPSTPTYVGGADSGGGTNTGAVAISFTDIKVQGRYAYVTKNTSGSTCSATVATGCELAIFDISSSTAPTYIGGGDASGVPDGAGGTTASTFSAISVQGKYAYIAKVGIGGTNCSQTPGSAQGCALQVWDISNPYAPTYIGGAASNGLSNSGNSPTNYAAVAVQGRFAYLGLGASSTACSVNPSAAGNGCEIQVFDVSSPSTPVFVAGLDAGGATNSGTQSEGNLWLQPYGRYLYATFNSNSTACSQVAGSAVGCEVKVFDISDPTNPLYMGGVDVNGSPTGNTANGANSIQVVGRNAYVTSNSSATACSQTPGSAGGCEYKIFDVSGFDVTSLQAGTIETGALQVNGNIDALGISNFRSLNVAMGGIMSNGPLSVFLASTTAATPVSATFLGGNVGIGTLLPLAPLDVLGLSSTTNLMVLASSTLQNFTGVNATMTQATTTNLFTNFINFVTGSSTNLTAMGSTTLQSFTFTTATGTAATSTNFYTSGQTVLAGTGGFLGVGTTTPFAFISALGNGTNPLFAVSTSSTAVSQKPVFEIDQVGRVNIAGPAPSISCTTAGSSLGSNSTDMAGIINTGSNGPKYCRLTFVNTWENNPVCIVTASGPTNNQFGSGVFASTTTTTLGIAEIATSTLANLQGMISWKIYYQCVNIH